MDALPRVLTLSAEIRNAGYLVRHYALQRTPVERRRRKEAIRRLGLAVRIAFSQSDEFELLLNAILDALAPRDEHRF